jgi:hypothetical protein
MSLIFLSWLEDQLLEDNEGNMVNRKILNNVLRNVIAGKEVMPRSGPASPSEAPIQDSLAPAPDMNVDKPVTRKRYYYYNALPSNSINFKGITSILEDSNKNEQRLSLVNSLKGGNHGKYFADYFIWLKVVISTTQYSQDGKSLVVYEVMLNPDGTKSEGTANIYPKDSNVTPEVFEKDINLFPNSSSGIISIDNSGESVYCNVKESPSNIVNILLNGGVPPKGQLPPLNYQNFFGVFDEFRIWSLNMNQLVYPDHSVPKTDGVPGGHYMGGPEYFNKIVGPYLPDIQQKAQPQQPSLKDKAEQQPSTEKSPFEPVDEQNEGRVKGNIIDKPTGSPMENSPNNKRFSSDAHTMKRMARKVIVGYLEEEASTEETAAMSMSQGTGGTSGGSSGGTSGVAKDLYEESEQHTKAGKKLKNVADELARMDR